MEAVRETTGGLFHPHIYLLDGTKLVAYIKATETEPFYFKNPIKGFDKRGRKFEKADVTLFQTPENAAENALIEVQGSKGATYWVDSETKTCTCPGFTFRGKCKHTDALVDRLAA